MASMKQPVPRSLESVAENRANLMNVLTVADGSKATGFEGLKDVFEKIFSKNPLPQPEVQTQPQQRGIFTPTQPKPSSGPGRRRRGRQSTVLSAASEEGLGG